jgi:thiol-disulfide isomerase/thioredoxin
MPGDMALGQSGTRSSHGDPAAHARLEQVAGAYKALTSYADEGQVIVATTLGGKTHREVQPLRVTFIRPGQLDLNAGAVRLISNGKTLTTVVSPLKSYMSVPAPETIGIDTFREGPAGTLLFGGPAGSPLFVLLNLLLGTSPDVMLDQMGGTLRAAPAGDVRPGADKPDPNRSDGDVIIVDLLEGPDLLLRVDPATKLLSAIEMKIEPTRPAKGAPAGRTPSIEHFGWTAGVVSMRVAADRPFAFVPPEGFTRIEDLKGPAPGARLTFEEKRGKPAPDFTLTVLDGPGKTVTLSRADRAGKVVVIDFWATWSGPCLTELPEIQKVVEHYSGTKNDVLIVALSQDTEPRGISEVRALVEKTLADRKINLTAGTIGRIGLDPSNSVGQAFDIAGIPLQVILDGTGIVQSVHVGYHSDIAAILTAEIDALLAGKSLAGGKDQGANEPKKQARENQ